jgi:hypothetical protein
MGEKSTRRSLLERLSLTVSARQARTLVEADWKRVGGDDGAGEVKWRGEVIGEGKENKFIKKQRSR